MLVQHLGIVPLDPDHHLRDPQMWHAVTRATDEAKRRLDMTLAGTPGYNGDGERPFLQVCVSEFTHRERGLDSWTTWGEGVVADDGQVHIGLMLEGTPSGKRGKVTPDQRRVKRGDWDRFVTRSFARHLGDVVPLLVRGYVMDDWYQVTDWADWGDESRIMPNL